jgi:polyhydroxybutyrate depolymerase
MQKRQTIIAGLMVALLILSYESKGAAAAEPPSTGKFLIFMHKAVERNYLLYLPKDLPDNAPLVFVLHGYRADARDYMAELGMNRVADANGFAVCYPQGAKDFEGLPHWNARLTISETDDIGFLSELAAYLQARHKLNPKRTFVSGISNGGFMSYALVAEKPEVFRAAASVIGTMGGHTWEHRDMIRPVPILQISGLDDEVIPYDGSMHPAGGWGGAPNQDEIIDFWTKLNQTKTAEVDTLSSQTTAHYYKGGVSGNEVWHYKIKGYGHRIPGEREMGIDAVDVIWKFFSKFPKNPVEKLPLPHPREPSPSAPTN